MNSNTHRNIAAKDLQAHMAVVNPLSGRAQMIRKIESGTVNSLGGKFRRDGETPMIRIVCEKGFSMTVSPDDAIVISDQACLRKAV